MYQILDLLSKQKLKYFRYLKQKFYKELVNGFYVYAKPNLCDTDTVVKYISRYLGRPVIATSRIDFYDGENVTFHYNKHEDNSYVEKNSSCNGLHFPAYPTHTRKAFDTLLRSLCKTSEIG